MHVSLIASRTLFSSARFDLMEERFATPDGEVTRPVIHHPGAVAILAQPTPDTLLLVRQYRYPLKRWTLEIPAGTRVSGEAAVVTAARELQEEAGMTAATLTEVTRFFPAAGVSDEELIVFRAEDLAATTCAPEHGELVSPVVLPLSEVSARLRAGELCDAKTLIALSLIGCWP